MLMMMKATTKLCKFFLACASHLVVLRANSFRRRTLISASASHLRMVLFVGETLFCSIVIAVNLHD